METRTVKAGISPRPLAAFDREGSLDIMFIDEKGFKVAHVLDAKGGIVIGKYDKDNALTETFFPADFLLAALCAAEEKIDPPSEVEEVEEKKPAKKSEAKKK